MQNSVDLWLVFLLCYATDSVIEQTEWKAASFKNHWLWADYTAYCMCKFITHLKWVGGTNVFQPGINEMNHIPAMWTVALPQCPPSLPRVNFQNVLLAKT